MTRWPECRDAALRQLAGDPILAPVLAVAPEPEFRPNGEHFRNVCEAIAFQQLSGKAATTIWKRFEAQVVEVVPQRVLNVSHDELRACGLSNAKASAIRDAAEKFDAGDVDPLVLEGGTDDEVIAELTQIRGVGPWSAHMLLIFDLGRADVFASGDLGIRKGIAKVFDMDTPDASEAERLAERWRPYRSVACWYLWRSLEVSFQPAGSSEPAG